MSITRETVCAIHKRRPVRRPTRDTQLADQRELFTTHLQTKFLPRVAMRSAFELQIFLDMPYLGNGLR